MALDEGSFRIGCPRRCMQESILDQHVVRCSANRACKAVISLVAIIASAAGCQTSGEGVWLDLAADIPTARQSSCVVVSLTNPGRMAIPAKRAEDLLPSGVLALEDARRVAVRANPDVHAALARLEGARARVMEARSRYYPTVSVTHTSARTLYTPASRNRLNLLQPAQPVPTDIDTQTLAVTTLLNAIRRPLFGLGKAKGNRNSYSEHSTALAVTWTVFDGYVREARVLAARHQAHAAFQSVMDVDRLIIQAVDSAYYQVQLAHEQIRIARADEQFSREQLDETTKLLAAGRATKADTDNFRVRTLAAQANVTAAVGLRETGRVILAELMGVVGATLPEEISLAPLTEETQQEMSLPDVEPWVERAIANRPDLKRIDEILRSERQSVRAAKGLYSPVIAVSASWGFDRSSTLRYTVEDQSAAGALELRWDLYTGGARRATVRAAQGSLAEMEAIAKRLQLSVESQIRRAVIDLADAQEQIRLQRENLKTAGENRRLVRVAYVAGKETLTRLNEAQRDFIQADADLALARIRVRQAWSDLDAAASTYRKDVAEKQP